ncbi:toxin C-terminal domain-containing protein [Paenibacillus gallinarum]|uniref:Novel toxin 21 domain-containing protein n=1 Tax=Paenibacillus gallinarum TaxID=2762232 RepID=A0ABR8T684_9BACL|nr:toxin C-terminal domain-containing protein [Paenibacillus gallinarum]MBD7971285.1 hypothetical protein [Paenibacillus gallinarum]
MTGKTLIKAAKSHGYEPTSLISKNNQKIFYNKKKKTYISQDVGSNNGMGPHKKNGVWKMAKSPEKLNSKTTRMGTYDANMTRIGD